ncbi:hypothetical protein [Ruegeria atlantica]|uniref:hypothetical protein n=1 Tax=Ruegeria atlantica TaxID=81569 RepID=UPI00147D5F67|nr:hypothetical protein [Ruegeria atlantica]
MGELLSIKFSGSNNSLNQFTINWLVDAFCNYKPLLAEILLSSVFVNLLALMIPLFFWVKIDKLILHQATITLGLGFITNR